MGRDDRDKLAIAEAPGDRADPAHARRRRRASTGSWLIGGTLPLRGDDPDRVRNASCVYAPDGSLAARYDKIHLFRFDNGRENYDEGRAIEAGSAPVALQAGPVRAGPERLLRPALSRAVPRR